MHYQRLIATGTTDKRTLPSTCSVDGCGSPVKAKGLCIKHYTRMIRHGSVETNVIVGNDAERMEANSRHVDGGCIEWIRFTRNGYGITCLGGKIEQAHRAAWILENGQIPDGMQINHRCHNRACINVGHLYLGTQKENMRDMDEAGRRRSARGERDGMAKLTEAQVLAIRLGNGTNAEVAEANGVSQSLISAVRNRKIWRHVK